jgi:hypothetical protein
LVKVAAVLMPKASQGRRKQGVVLLLPFSASTRRGALVGDRRRLSRLGGRFGLPKASQGRRKQGLRLRQGHHRGHGLLIVQHHHPRFPAVVDAAFVPHFV